MKKTILAVFLTLAFVFGLGLRGRYDDWTNGEYITDDTIDDDSIDWSDCTFADFDYETNHKMWHSDGSGDVTEITLGANGTFLESNGASAAPAFRTLASTDIDAAGVSLLGTATLSVTGTGQTTIYTVPAGKRCILDHIKIVAGATASPTAIVRFGIQGTTNDFVGDYTMTNLAAQYDCVIIMPVPNTTPVKTKSYAAAAVIEADVTTADGDGGTDNAVYVFGTLY